MPLENFKTRLKKLPISKKLVLFGAFLVVIGVFMPWYKDIDKFNTGDMFLGITGPLYLAGLIVLAAGAANFGVIFTKLLGKKTPNLPLSENHFFIFSSALSVLMLILTSSVYFHPKFGINLMNKSMGIGMILGFVGTGIVILGSILSMKKREVNFDEEGELKPLIDIETRERVQSSLDPETKAVQKEVVDDQKIHSSPREEQPFETASKNRENGQNMAEKSMQELYRGHDNTNDIL